MNYDPMIAPDPAVWQATNEGERIAAVAAYHRQQRIKLPNPICTLSFTRSSKTSARWEMSCRCRRNWSN